ncbi:MAG TPA: RHS repeat-associated core domain-containing protein [Syntrophales bacterium]|nr:RHS repeat-associated core domain-containing protein [Syntrophales bacterium]
MTRYGYDGIGNLTSKRTGGVQLVYAYDSSRPHAVRSVRNGGKTHYFSYDANGNLTYGPDLTDSSSVGWRSLSWTAENRPSEIKYKDKKTVPLTIRFEYDGEGRRTVKTVSVPTLSTGGNINPKAVSTTVYVNDAFQVANGKAVVHLFAGTVRIAEVRSGSVLYHHKDHLGSATVLTDKNGNRVETAEYLPFGELRESTGSWTTDYKFTDHELDTETGLYNFNASLYDPAVGRFISPDPALPDLANSKNPWNYDPQMLNRYAYCRNNPLIYVDPNGCEAIDADNDGRSDHDSFFEDDDTFYTEFTTEDGRRGLHGNGHALMNTYREGDQIYGYFDYSGDFFGYNDNSMRYKKISITYGMIIGPQYVMPAMKVIGFGILGYGAYKLADILSCVGDIIDDNNEKGAIMDDSFLKNDFKTMEEMNNAINDNIRQGMSHLGNFAIEAEKLNMRLMLKSMRSGTRTRK